MNDNFSNKSINLKGINIKRTNKKNIIKDNNNLNQNITNDPTNINNIENKEKKQKYNYNFSKIIREGKNLSDNEENHDKIQYNCNLCLNSLNIDIANKLNAFCLLTFINQKKDSNYVYYLNNRIFKNIDKFKGIDNFIFIRNLYRASQNLLKIENNYFYALYYCELAKNISKKSQIDDNSKYLLNQLLNEINQEISQYINRKKNLLNNVKSYSMEQVYYIKNILDGIEKENNFDNNQYYLINKKWVEKAKYFFDEYEKLRKSTIKEDFDFFMQHSFNSEKVYKYYIDNLNNNPLNYNDLLVPIFPGPINNYSITLFKDFWYDSLKIDSQENYFIKEGLEINKDYYLIKEDSWKCLNVLFQSTNEIIRKGNDYDLKIIKCIIFDKSLKNEKKRIELRRKYIQISKKKNVFDLKLKILRFFDNNNNEMNEKYQNTNIQNINLTKKIKFYILDYNKKSDLSEIIIAYVNSIESIKYDIQEINVDDSLIMENFPYDGLKKKNILLIEINNENEKKFLNENDNRCIQCNNLINKELNFKCEICNIFQFCSKICYSNNILHSSFHFIFKDYLIEEFSLKQLFETNLSNIVKINSNHGLSGLQNLGCTCFLNSVIQCLSNTEDLTKYFLLNYYQQQMNMANKLGAFGQFAEKYSNLIKSLWNDLNYPPKTINPQLFVNLIRKQFPNFLPNVQQDAHEFLSLFLDTLHEDINRISIKQYINLKEKQIGEDDITASNRWWKSHKLREDSIVSDLFYGQYKSDIKCLSCKKSSITYDPFMFLPLPIPSFINIKTTIKLFYRKKCFFFDFSVSNDSTLLDMKNRCFELDGLNELGEKNIHLLEGAVLNKEKIITKIIRNDNELIIDYLKNDSEICFFRKESLDCFNIYCYPIKITEESGFFTNKKIINFLSYPLGISVNFNTSLENLNLIIQSEFCHMIKTDLKGKLFNLLIYHNYEIKGLHFFSTKPTCEFCNQTFNLSSPFCALNSHFSNNDNLGKIVNKIQNERPFILLFLSNFYLLNSFLYSNMQLDLSYYISQPICQKNDSLNIYDCLELFKKEEKLNDNEWYCNQCKNHKSALKKVLIYRAPNYLVIHLKRFQVNNNFIIKGECKKNELFVNFPIKNFSLFNYVIGPNKNTAIYDLYGVVEHFGGLQYGHYIAKCKNFEHWYKYNDSHVSEISEKDIVTPNAYLLFYKKLILEDNI